MGAGYGTTIAGDANGAQGSSTNRLFAPARVLLDSTGGVYISDAGNYRVQFWNNGALSGTTVAGLGKKIRNTKQY
jgi:hypothetical protein